ncbi:LolA family protein [Roseivirga echinicomitans]
MRRILGFLIVMVVSSMLTVVQAQDPKVVLDKMSATYKAMPGFEIEFVQKVMNEAEVLDRFSGTAAVSKEKFMIKFRDQHIYCNGPVLWTYLVEAQELTITNFEPEETFINPTNIYDIYKKGFKYTYQRSENMGGTLVDVIELVSTDEDSDFTNIIMYIDKNTSYLKAWDLIDYDGIKTAFEVAKFKPNMTYATGFFEFDPKKNPVQHTEDYRN